MIRLSSCLALFLAGLALLPSCAYLQTHKNVEAALSGGETAQAYLLEEPLLLGSNGGQYYLKGHAATVKKRYPNRVDELLFVSDKQPHWTLKSQEAEASWLPISESSARLLQTKGAYISSETLLQEVYMQHAQGRAIGRQVADIRPVSPDVLKASANFSGERKSDREDLQLTLLDKNNSNTTLPAKLMGTVDFLVIDVPGTLLYNVALPFCAPFVFFSEFIHND